MAGSALAAGLLSVAAALSLGLAAVGGAAVTAQGRDLLIIETDNDGRFQLRGIPAGTYLLRVQGRPMIVAEKLRHYADPEFQGLHAAQAS